MPLYERMMGTEEPKIPIHAFFAAMQEYALGIATAGQVIAAFNLNATEQAEALALYNKIMLESEANGGLMRRVKAFEYENVLILAERGLAYTTAAQIKSRLGV